MTVDWWTLGFQTVNVAVLIWLLGHFFWKPVAGMIAARQADAQKLTGEAMAAKAETEAALAERAGFSDEREAILVDAHQAADKQQAARRAEAATEIAALHATAEAAIAKNEQAAAAAWQVRSSELAVVIARRLAERLKGEIVDACFLDWLITEIAKLPSEGQKTRNGRQTMLEATTPRPLKAAECQHIAAMIGNALGGSPAIAFKTDAALIAGIELRGEHLIVDSSWRADLAAIRTDLGKTSTL
jgi:F-type H+-transporting ATPase subunit b